MFPVKKTVASLISLVVVGNSFSSSQVLAKNSGKISFNLNDINVQGDENILKILKSDPRFEKQKLVVYLQEKENVSEVSTSKKEGIKKQTEEAKEGMANKILSKISKAFSSIVGFFKPRRKKPLLEKIEEFFNRDPFSKSLIKHAAEIFKIFEDLTTENYNITYLKKTHQDLEELKVFFTKFNEEAKKPGNDILKCFSNALVSDEFEEDPLLKVTSKSGKIIGYVRCYRNYSKVEFIPCFLNKQEAKQALTEIILSFNKRLKEIKVDREKVLKEAMDLAKESSFFRSRYTDLNFVLEMLKDEILLVPFSGKGKDSDDYEIFLKELAESVKKDFSKVETQNLSDGQVYRFCCRLVP